MTFLIPLNRGDRMGRLDCRWYVLGVRL